MSGPDLCPKCKGFHYRNSPCIVRVTKSTAARKDVSRIDRPVPETSGKLYGSGESPAGEMSRSADASKQRVAESVAGAQDLPVDTKLLSPVERSAGPQLESRVQRAPGALPTPGLDLPKRPRGRPKTITDMKAYKAAKAREYRARKANGTSH